MRILHFKNKVIWAVILIAVFLSVDCFAQQTPQSGIDAENMIPYIPEDIYKDLPSDFFTSEATDLLSSGSGEIFRNAISKYFRAGIGKAWPVVAELFAILISASVFGAIHQTDNECSKVVDFALTASVSVLLYHCSFEVYQSIQLFLEQLHCFVSGTMGLQIGLYLSQGNSITAATISASSSILLTVIETVSEKILLPIFVVCFGFSLVMCFSELFDFSGIVKSIRNALYLLMGFVATIGGAIMLYQQKIALSADSLAAKSIKFASAGFIPLVGSALGDATRAVMASVSLIKNTVGAIGIIIIIFLLLSPILLILIYRVIFWGASLMASAFGLKRQNAMIGECCAILDIAVAVVCFSATVFLFVFALLIQSGAACV